MNKLATYVKAAVAGATAFGAAFGSAVSDGNVTLVEWAGIATATVVAVVALFVESPKTTAANREDV